MVPLTQRALSTRSTSRRCTQVPGSTSGRAIASRAEPGRRWGKTEDLSPPSASAPLCLGRSTCQAKYMTTTAKPASQEDNAKKAGGWKEDVPEPRRNAHIRPRTHPSRERPPTCWYIRSRTSPTPGAIYQLQFRRNRRRYPSTWLAFPLDATNLALR